MSAARTESGVRRLRRPEAAPWPPAPAAAESPPARSASAARALLGTRSPRSRRALYRVRLVRRALAAGLVGVAVWAVVGVLLPSPAGARVPAVVAARDLPAGAVLGLGDLTVVPRSPAELPREAARDPARLLGQPLAGPVAEGDVLTAVRLRGRGMLTGHPPDTVAVGLPLADATLASSLRTGDAVGVHSAGAAAEVTRGTVLAVDTGGSSALTGQGGAASVVLAVPARGASAVAAAMGGPSPGFVLTLHP